MEAPLVRIAVEHSPRHGLHKTSQLMVDKLFTVPIEAWERWWGVRWSGFSGHAPSLTSEAWYRP